MPNSYNRDSEYCKSTDDLFGRFLFFYHHCEEVIQRFPPQAAVIHIRTALESLRPHVSRHNRARALLLGPDMLAKDKPVNPEG